MTALGGAVVTGLPAAADPVGTSSTAVDPASAARQAVASGQRVEATGSRTETGQLFANPDGTFTWETYAQPVRVHQPDGSWVAPDTTLSVAGDGSLVPAATVTPLVLSGGGSGPLVSVGAAGAQVSLSWPTPLPTPTLSGDTATYPDVLPGVDLKVKALVQGFSEVLVVNDAAAAANPALKTVTFSVATQGLTLQARDGGSVRAVDAAGHEVFGTGTAVMWDSTPASASGSAKVDASPADGTGEGHTVTVPMALSAGALTLSPDQGMLSSTSTTFPVVIDPSFGVANWTMINGRYQDQSYWTCTSVECDRTWAKVGYYDDPTYGWQQYRSMFAFADSVVNGTHVLSAEFDISLAHSATCDASLPSSSVYLYVTGAISSGTTWTNSHGNFTYLSAASGVNCNDSSNMPVLEFNATAGAVLGASNGSSRLTLGLAEPNESSSGESYWKRFSPGSAKLSVTINHVPGTPNRMTVGDSPTTSAGAKTCATGTGRPAIDTATPTLRAVVPDADTTDRLTVTFSWFPVNGSTYGSQLGSGSQQVPAGGTALYTVPSGLSDGGTYAWHVVSKDAYDTSPTSAWCEFTVDATPPGTPGQVSSTDYPSDGNEHGQVGQTGTFTFSPPATHPEDVAAYVYALNGDKVSEGRTVAAAASTYTATVKVTPFPDINSHDACFLTVWTKDKAGNVSAAPLRYDFLVAPGQGPVGWWKLDDGTGSTAADSSATGAFPGTVSSSGATWESHGGYGDALHLDGTSGQVTTAPGVLSTDQSYTVAAWVQLTNLNNYATVVSEEGTTQSGFFLQYNKSLNRWVFIAPASDTSSTYYESMSAAAPATGVWTHLAGVYDAATATLTLYVNGVAQPSASIPVPWKVTGKLHIGAALTTTGVANFVNGDIDDVRAYSRALSPTEIHDLADAPALVGAWDLADGAGTTATDSSGVTPSHDATLGEGESWTAVDPGQANPSGLFPQTGTAVNFDAQTCTATSGPVLRSDQSFTVAAWVRVDDVGDYRTAVSQAGTTFSTPFLQYSKSFDRWAFVLPTASNPAYVQSTATSAAPPTVGQWTHLVGVYDAGAATMTLYVNGVAEGHVTNVPASWNSTGALRIGCAYDGTTNYNYWSGDIAEVRIYQGVADQAFVNTLMTS